MLIGLSRSQSDAAHLARANGSEVVPGTQFNRYTNTGVPGPAGCPGDFKKWARTILRLPAITRTHYCPEGVAVLIRVRRWRCGHIVPVVPEVLGERNPAKFRSMVLG